MSWWMETTSPETPIHSCGQAVKNNPNLRGAMGKDSSPVRLQWHSTVLRLLSTMTSAIYDTAKMDGLVVKVVKGGRLCDAMECIGVPCH